MAPQHGPAAVNAPRTRAGSAVRLLSVLAVCVLSAVGLYACDDTKTVTKSAAGNEIVKVKIKDTTFKLELVADETTRIKGMGGRDEIKEDEGMLFAFPRAMVLDFVMRDCPIDIDVIFLDSGGRVTATHAMKAETARSDEEKKLDPKTGANEKYEKRLKRYSSRYNAQYAIELKGGTLEKLKLKNAEKIKLDLEALKKRIK